MKTTPRGAVRLAAGFSSPPRRVKAPWQTARYACRLARRACRSSSQKSRCAAIFGSPVYFQGTLIIKRAAHSPPSVYSQGKRGKSVVLPLFEYLYGIKTPRKFTLSAKAAGMRQIECAYRKARLSDAQKLFEREKRQKCGFAVFSYLFLSILNFTFYILHLQRRFFVALLLRMTGREGICTLLAFPLGGRCRRSRRKRGVGPSSILHSTFYILHFTFYICR